MRPYPGHLPEEEQLFNYRQSTSRFPIENAFGILVARFRIFQRPIIATVHNVQFYVLSCLCLHNYLRQTENSLYCPYGFVDIETANGEIKEEEWRSIKLNQNCLENVKKMRGGRRKDGAKEIREYLKHYFNNFNILPWQLAKVRNVGPINEA